MSNHASFMDFILVMLTVYPRRLNAVVAQKFFLYWPLNWLLPFMGCIPKNLFDSDTRPIRGIASVIKRGGSLLIFPEARCSTDGAYMGMHRSTGKLLKKFGIPLISCRVEGAYNCMPFWRTGIRLGRQKVTLANLLSAEDLRQMTPDAINSRIDNRLSGADAPAALRPLRVFKASRLAEGLQHILYYCPRCGREFTMETKGNTIYCTACGNTAVMDSAARLIPAEDSVVPETIHAWFKQQVLHAMQAFNDDMEPVQTPVTVRMPRKAGQGLIRCGQGELRLDREGWHFIGALSGQKTELFFPLKSVPAMPFDPNDNFQIYANGNFYVFTPAHIRACVQFAILGECAYWRFADPVHMTPGYDSGYTTEAASPCFCPQYVRTALKTSFTSSGLPT